MIHIFGVQTFSSFISLSKEWSILSNKFEGNKFHRNVTKSAKFVYIGSFLLSGFNTEW